MDTAVGEAGGGSDGARGARERTHYDHPIPKNQFCGFRPKFSSEIKVEINEFDKSNYGRSHPRDVTLKKVTSLDAT